MTLTFETRALIRKARSEIRRKQVAAEARLEYDVFHDADRIPQARTCVECGVGWDDRSPECKSCSDRHSNRKRLAMKRLEESADTPPGS